MELYRLCALSFILIVGVLFVLMLVVRHCAPSPPQTTTKQQRTCEDDGWKDFDIGES